jgi:hypothetical protein
MPNQTDEGRLPRPSGGGSHVPMPPLFAKALGQIRAVTSRCAQADVPDDTIIAVLMTELLSRLDAAYGPAESAAFLQRIASEVSSSRGRDRHSG